MNHGNTYRVLVCGGRDYSSKRYLFDCLTMQNNVRPFTTLIEGGARGADRLAREWAEANNVPVETYEADWDAHGKQAGYFRNRRMLVEGKPDIVIGFEGGRGTKMMLTIAKNANVPVLRF